MIAIQQAIIDEHAKRVREPTISHDKALKLLLATGMSESRARGSLYWDRIRPKGKCEK